MVRSFRFCSAPPLKMVETLFKIGVVGGVTGVEMRATLIQLSQGFGKGRLDGIELTSVMEQMAPLAALFADALGVPIGKLKELGAAGKITNDVITKVLIDNANLIDAKFDLTAVTIQQAMTMANNKWVVLIGTINEATGASGIFKDSMIALVNVFEFLTTAIDDANSAQRRFFQDLNEGNPIGMALIAGAKADVAIERLGSSGPGEFFGPENPLAEAFNKGLG